MEAQRLYLNNYTHYYSYRSDIRGGGVSIYVHNSIKHSHDEDIYKDGNNYLWIKLPRFALDVGVIYKPGDTNHASFMDTFSQQLEKRNRAVVFGDFNLDLLSTTTHVTNYKGMLLENGYTLLNKEHTTPGEV